MCGIAGFCGPANRFTDGDLWRMLRGIEHRGPDDSGAFSRAVPGRPECRVWLGNQRLAIHDLSPGGHQPMVDAASHDAIALNGEIYNFRELRAELESERSRFRSRCDAEVAFQAWRRWSLEGIRRWRGMFGAALWNEGKGELWLARDEWGIKPLYYRWDGEGLAFCSEVRPLISLAKGEARLEWRGVEDYLRFGAVQDPVTLVEGVYALLPGHVLRWSKGRIDIQRFARPFEQPDGRCRDVASELAEVVRQQLSSDVPVTVFLSGGIDSSVVALLARKEAGPGVNTMSVVFDDPKYSERDFARRVAGHIHTDHHEILLRPDELRDKAIQAIARMDQPTADGINTYVISEAARRAGFTVALSGLGGDEFFGGYSTFRRTPALSRMLAWCRRAPRLAHATGRLLAPCLTRFPGGPRKLGQYFRHGDFREHPYFLQRTMFFPPQIQRLGCRSGSEHAERSAEARARQLLDEAGSLEYLNQVSYLEARTYMTDTLLRDSDQMSMAHSLELRVPFVDRNLAAYALTLSPEQKGFGRVPKLLLRQAFERHLPREVFHRKKMGFTLPFERWLKTSLRAEVCGTLGSGEFWPPAQASQIWEEFDRDELDWSRPWALYVLSRWVSRNLPWMAQEMRERQTADCIV